MKLTDIACKSAKPAEKNKKLADGGGLYLLVKPNGKKYWRLKYSHLGKEKTLAIGVYPLVTLAEAREARDAAKKLLMQGIDPTNAKKQEKRLAVRNAQNTFKATALEWYDTKKPEWSESHAKNVLHRLETDIFPHIANWPIKDIKAPDLLDVLRKIEKRGAWDLAIRTRQICGQVFRYGIQLGRCERNPAEDLHGALKTRKTEHYAAITPDELPELVQAVHRNDARLYPSTRNAILLSLLLFQRPTEIREAKWSEIDFNKGLWTIPPERMKKRLEHIVPLSRQAIQILREQKEEVRLLKTDWVFPGLRPRKAMSNNTVRIALQKLGFKGRMTAHGFRALARTAIREVLDYPPDVIEAQLAHKPSGPLGATYDRSVFLKQRAAMMQEWADYVDTVTTGGTVIHANFKKERGVV